MADSIVADSIVAQLQAASDAYYNGKPLLMDDDDFDALVEKLRVIDPKNPFFKTVGATVGAGAVKLPYLMPSLDKIKPGEDSLRRFLAGQAFVVSEKLDGLSALWSPSKKNLYLRGDGVEGQDISKLSADMQGLRADGKAKFGVVRGEIVLERSQTVKGPARSWVNGLIHQISPAASEVAKLRFVAYEVLFPSRLSRSAQFAWLEEAGYETPWHMSAAAVTEEALKAWLVERRAQSKYDTDGIVIGYDAVTDVKAKALKNPKDCVAFKMPLADQKAVTKVLAVEWNTSAQGYLIPRIQFEPVTIGGAVIQYCTGHNARAILTGGVGPGAMICIRRSGDVIPTLESVVTPCAAAMPSGGVWDGDEATAAHMRMASGTTSKELVTSQMGYFLKKLEIPGAGPSTWKELVDAGIDTPKKLWDTGAPRLSEILGPKTGATLHASLRKAFATVDEQTLMIASSLMPRSVGEVKLKALFDAEADPRRWTALTTVPDSWSADSLKAFQAVYPQYETWRQQITWVAYPILKVAAVAPVATPKGKVESICFTGFRDKDLEAKLVAAGHVIHGAVTGKTTILVTPDDGAETEKIKKARATGIRVLKRSEAALL